MNYLLLKVFHHYLIKVKKMNLKVCYIFKLPKSLQRYGYRSTGNKQEKKS